MASHPGVEVTFVRDGTTKIMARLRAEIQAGNTPADLLLIADSVTMVGMAEDNLLLGYTDADVSDYEPSIQDPKRQWFPTKIITTGIIYNINAPITPTSWNDLFKDETKGQVRMPSPLTSGAALIHTNTMVSNIDQGWSYYEGMAKNGAQANGGNGGVLKVVAGREALYGMVVDFLPIREKAKGAPVDFVFPKEGVSAIPEPVAILSSARNPEAAKVFFDFLLSIEGQELTASQGYMPAHPDVQPLEGFPTLSDINVMAFVASSALASSEEDKKRFATIFGQN